MFSFLYFSSQSHPGILPAKTVCVYIKVPVCSVPTSQKIPLIYLEFALQTTLLFPLLSHFCIAGFHSFPFFPPPSLSFLACILSVKGRTCLRHRKLTALSRFLSFLFMVSVSDCVEAGTWLLFSYITTIPCVFLEKRAVSYCKMLLIF